MSKCMPKDEDFIQDIRQVADRYTGTEIEVYYDAHPRYSKRDYVLKMRVPRKWSTEDSRYLKQALRDAGATCIIGRKFRAIARDYLDFAFDRKVFPKGRNHARTKDNG